MKLRGASLISALALLGSIFSASPAEARSTPAPVVAEAPSEAVGFIVKYQPRVSPIAPNGEPTGENYAGVDLENSRDLGSGFKSVDFGADLTPEQAAEAQNRLELDPRVQSVSLNRVFQAANYVAKPILSSILPKNDPMELPIVIRSAVRLPYAPVASAADAWIAPNRVAVTLTWTKPTNRISGTIKGYKIQIYASGAWRTLVSRSSSAARSYTATTGYLKAGTQARLRIAAVSYYYGRYYTGSYRTVYATPTALPRANTHVLVENSGNEVRFSWSPLVSQYDMGGMQVAYDLVVTRGGNTETCSTFTSTTCVISPAVEGGQYSATLRITNDHGTVTVGPVTVTFTTSLAVASNDQYFNNQWHLKSGVSNPYGMKVVDAWTTESGSPNVYVAVLDTGITDHPDLNGNVVTGYDMISSTNSSNDGDGRDSDPSDPGDWNYSGSNHDNSSWHGTHVAGIIAAIDNNIGVLGVAPNVKIIPVRVLGTEGGTEADIVAGLNWAVGQQVGSIPLNAHPASVINMSIGGQGSCLTSSPTATVLRSIKDLGITVVTAAGNDSGYASLSYPGNCVPTINVGATGKTGKPAFYSNYGDAVDIAAPGGDYCYQTGAQLADGQIFSTLNTGTTAPGSATYGYELGTSMAAPAVAGVVALMYSAVLRKSPTFTPDATFVTDIYYALRDTARDGVGTGVNKVFSAPIAATPSGNTCAVASSTTHTYGAGIIDAAAALANILN